MERALPALRPPNPSSGDTQGKMPALHSLLPLADRLARGDEVLEQAILQFLVDLNHERAAEEA